MMEVLTRYSMKCLSCLPLKAFTRSPKVVMPIVEADVAFGLGKLDFTKEEVKTRVRKALDAVGMLPYLHRPVQTRSGGQKQRLTNWGHHIMICLSLSGYTCM